MNFGEENVYLLIERLYAELSVETESLYCEWLSNAFELSPISDFAALFDLPAHFWQIRSFLRLANPISLVGAADSLGSFAVYIGLLWEEKLQFDVWRLFAPFLAARVGAAAAPRALGESAKKREVAFVLLVAALLTYLFAAESRSARVEESFAEPECAAPALLNASLGVVLLDLRFDVGKLLARRGGALSPRRGDFEALEERVLRLGLRIARLEDEREALRAAAERARLRFLREESELRTALSNCRAELEKTKGNALRRILRESAAPNAETPNLGERETKTAIETQLETFKKAATRRIDSAFEAMRAKGETQCDFAALKTEILLLIDFAADFCGAAQRAKTEISPSQSEAIPRETAAKSASERESLVEEIVDCEFRCAFRCALLNSVVSAYISGE